MPTDNAPLYVELLLWLIYVLLLATAAVIAWSTVRSLRLGGSQRVQNRIRVRRIACGVVLLLAVSVAVTLGLSTTQPIVSNGHPFTDTFWLRTSDVLIGTSLLLLAAAVTAVLFGASGLNRRIK